MGCRLQSTQFRAVVVDGSTELWDCEVNQPCAKARGTDFTGAGLSGDFGLCSIGRVGNAVCGIVYGRRADREVCR